MSTLYGELQRVARKWSARSEDVEDIVQESLLAAHAAGKSDLTEVTERRWITAVIRNQARLAARSAVRRRRRETEWRAEQDHAPSDARAAGPKLDFSELPPALRAVASLAWHGLDRREIRHLLSLTDEVLRKRVSTLRKRLAAVQAALPERDGELPLELAYGRIRQALLSVLRRRQGHFATHDPDGHLLVIRRR